MLEMENIHHVAVLTGNDLYETCKKFYTAVLGFEVIAEYYREERKSYKLDLALNGVYRIELFSFPAYKERASFPEAKGLRHLAFSVKDVQKGYEWLLQNKVHTEPVRVDEFTGKRFLFFYDPNGQPLELYEI